MQPAAGGTATQSLNRAIISNNRLRKDLHILIKERDAARRITKDRIRGALEENSALTELSTQLSHDLHVVRSENRAIESRIATLQPLTKELEFWRAERENLVKELQRQKEKEAELQKHSFEALVIPFSAIHLRKQIGSVGQAAMFEARVKQASGEWSETVTALLLEGSSQLSTLVEMQEELSLMRYLSKNRCLATLRGVSVAPDPFVIVVEHFPAGELASFLADDTRSTTLSWALRLKIAQDVADGVYSCHTMLPAQIYGNLSAENIWLTDASAAADARVAKLSVFDFLQFSRIGELLARARKNPGWTAPEVLRDEAYSFRSDSYSFGVLLWALYARRRPFDELWTNATPRAERERHVLEGVRPALPDECPSDYKELIEWCWHQDPNARPSFPLILERLSALAQKLAPPLPNQVFGRFAQRSEQIETEFSALLLVDTQVWGGCADGALHVWSRETGKEVASPVQAHSGAVNALLYNGDRCVWSASGDRSVRLWHIPLREASKAGMLNKKAKKAAFGRTKWKTYWFVLKQQEILYYVSPRAAEPKGSIELDDAVMMSVDVKDKEHVFQLNLRGGAQVALQARSAAEKSEWISVLRNQVARIKDPSLAAVKMLVDLALSAPVLDLHRTADFVIASLADSTLACIDASTYELKNTVTLRLDRKVALGRMAQASGHMLCVVAERDIVLVNARSMEQLGLLQGHATRVSAMLAIGKDLWTAAADETLRVWNVDTRQCLAVLDASTGPVCALILAGNYVWCTGRDGLIRLFDTKAYFLVKELERRHHAPIASLLYVGDNRVWSGSLDRTFGIWIFPSSRIPLPAAAQPASV